MLFTKIVWFVGIFFTTLGETKVHQGDYVNKQHEQFEKMILRKRSYRASRRDIGRPFSTITQDLSAVTPKVETTSGIVAGTTTEKCHEFYEIPYAKPPTGELRWKDPEPITEPLTEINATTNNYLHCYVYPGRCSEAEDDFCPHYESEDCLVLNVFVPNPVNLSADHRNPPGVKLPVLFYIHGGSFSSNSGTEGILNGEELSNVTNTVVVTINYRLGALGFLYHEEEGQETIKGNQGLKDQRLAMHWVQDNIANFGGDKDRVTLFGNSAGAQSVGLHAASPKSKDLYTNTIQQSNPHIYSFYYPDRAAALRITDRLVKSMNCDQQSPENERECLMNASPEEIMNQMSPVETQTAAEEMVDVYAAETFMPMIDGEEFTGQLVELYRNGKWNKDKSMIIGVNTQESEDSQYFIDKNMVYDENTFIAANIAIFGEELGRAISAKYMTSYPPAEGEDYRVTIGIETSHYYFDCPSRLLARYVSNTTESSVFFYANSHPVLNRYCVEQNDGNKTGCYLAFHASEIEYVFRNAPQGDNFTDADQTVEDEFSTYWGSFSRTSDPSNGLENSLGVFESWPEYKKNIETGGNQQPWSHMHITAPESKVESAYKEDICEFWDSINYGINDPTTAPSKESTTTAPGKESTTSEGHKAYSSLFGIVAIGLASFWNISY